MGAYGRALVVGCWRRAGCHTSRSLVKQTWLFDYARLTRGRALVGRWCGLVRQWPRVNGPQLAV